MRCTYTFGIAIILAFICTDSSAQPLEEIRVSVKRLPDAPSEAVYSASLVDRDGLNGPAFGLDDALRRVPGFGLFRRQAARGSHPTTQGVNLRGLGPNGAGRTLVLLDGVPQNDPFGGWVEWVNLPPLFIEQATVVRGGGAGPWGNAALAGVVRLDGRVLEDDVLSADIRGGSKESFAGSAVVETEAAQGTLTAAVHATDTDGYFLIGRDQRGAADQPAARNSEGLRLGWRTQTAAGPIWSVNGSYASDDFVNGSDVAGAETKSYGLSLSALHDRPARGPAWQTNFYVRHKDFASVFGAFDGSRDSVRPVLDQFDVPATSVGGNALLRWSGDGSWTIEGGADVRYADGETNERFRNLGAGFTRERTAGGEQWIGGAFVEGNWQQTEHLLLTAGARIDRWQQSNGVRREIDLADGAVLVDRAFDKRSGWVTNGRIGVRSEITPNIATTTSGYTGFRIPTLNELYRPFRVGNDITEANASLENERMVGVELNIHWTTQRFSASAGVFRNDLFDPIVNATVTTTPGFNADFGVFILGGGSLRQRRNVNRVETWGLETDVSMQVSDQVQMRLAYLLTSPEIKRSDVSPVLEGNRLAQVAKHQGTFSVLIQPLPQLHIAADVLASSRQFEDDLNSRILASAVTLDAQIAYDFTENTTAYVAVENLFDERIEAGRSANGLVTLGAPMFLWAGLRLSY